MHVGFCCTAKWTCYTYKRIPSFLDFLPIQVTTKHWVEFPVTHSGFSLAICFICSSAHMSVPISQVIPPMHFPCWCACVCSLHLCLYFCFVNRFICTIFQRQQWHPTPVLLPGQSHGWRSLVGCSPWGRTNSDTTEAT